MPTTLADTLAFPAVTIPAGSEARTITSLAGAFQALTSRTASLLHTLSGIVQNRNGVFFLQHVGSIAEMVALPAGGTSGAQHNQVLHVLGNGIWQWDEFASGAEVPNALVAASTTVGGFGRWRALTPRRDVVNGVQGLDANGRTPAGIAHFATVYANAVSPNMFMTGSGTAQVVPGSQMGVEMLAGDLAYLWMNGTVQTVSLSESIESDTRVVVAQPDGVAFPPDALQARLFGAGSGAGNVLSFQYTGFFRATQNGHHEFRIQTSLSSGSSSTGGWGGGNFFIDVKRP